MKYTIWLHWRGRSASTCAIVSNAPLRESLGYDWDTHQPKYREFGDHVQTKVELEARDDARAWWLLNEWLKKTHPNEKRPIQGISYLRMCRQSMRKAKAVPR